MHATLSLPFDDTAGGQARRGLNRLKGAFLIDIKRIRSDPNQPRRAFDAQKLADLTASIAERGIRQPLRVHHIAEEDVYQIVSGERRFRAAQAAGLAQVPCIIDEAPTDARGPNRQTVLTDQIVENWQRADLQPYELSDALCELRDEHGLSQNDIAKMTGKPKSEISRFLSMQRVAPAVQSLVRADTSGRYSRRHVVALAKLSDDAQQQMASRILDEHLTAEQTEQEVTRKLKRGVRVQGRGAKYTVRDFAVGTARVQITFRASSVTKTDVLNVLAEAQRLAEAE